MFALEEDHTDSSLHGYSELEGSGGGSGSGSGYLVDDEDYFDDNEDRDDENVVDDEEEKRKEGGNDEDQDDDDAYDDDEYAESSEDLSGQPSDVHEIKSVNSSDFNLTVYINYFLFEADLNEDTDDELKDFTKFSNLSS